MEWQWSYGCDTSGSTDELSAVLPVPQNALSRNHLKELLTWQREEVDRYGQRYVAMKVGAIVLEATHFMCDIGQ